VILILNNTTEVTSEDYQLVVESLIHTLQTRLKEGGSMEDLFETVEVEEML
jgi:hypothetical protein